MRLGYVDSTCFRALGHSYARVGFVVAISKPARGGLDRRASQAAK
jgi:hypothetical protein